MFFSPFHEYKYEMNLRFLIEIFYLLLPEPNKISDILSAFLFI
jgi:hypothetical protein